MYYRKVKEKQRLHKLAKKTRYKVSGAYYNEEKHYYIRFYRSHLSVYLKGQSNRKIRRTVDIGNNGKFKKVYDFWCSLW